MKAVEFFLWLRKIVGDRIPEIWPDIKIIADAVARIVAVLRKPTPASFKGAQAIPEAELASAKAAFEELDEICAAMDE